MKNTTYNPQLKKGFTLVELIVVIAVIALSLPVFFNLIFNLGKQQANLAALQQVKEEGDFAQQLIINTIKTRAVEVVGGSTCSTLTGGTTQVCFKDEAGDLFGYSVSASSPYQLASHSATTTSILIGASEAQFPITITSPSSTDFLKLNDKTTSFKYTLTYTPPVEYLASPTLTYSFYAVMRRSSR